MELIAVHPCLATNRSLLTELIGNAFFKKLNYYKFLNLD